MKRIYSNLITIIFQGMKCKLAVDNIANIVAEGHIMATSGVIHGKELGESNYRVSVDYVADESAKLPFPIPDEMSLVVHASGSIVEWPKHLIILDVSQVFYTKLLSTDFLEI